MVRAFTGELDPMEGYLRWKEGSATRARLLIQACAPLLKETPDPLAQILLSETNPLGGVSKGITLREQQYGPSSFSQTKRSLLTMQPALEMSTSLGVHLDVHG